MSVQTRYNFATPQGIPGGLVDLSEYVVDTRLNEAANGALMFGMGVVQGSVPGSNVKLPASGAAIATFEGITVNGFTQQHDLEGKIALNNNQSVGILRSGRIWVRVEDEDEPAYGDQLYLVITGDEAGFFTSTESSGNTLALNGRFISGVSGGIARVELFNNQSAVVGSSGGASGATSLSGLSDVDLSVPATNGQVLKYDTSTSKWKPGDDSTGA